MTEPVLFPEQDLISIEQRAVTRYPRRYARQVQALIGSWRAVRYRYRACGEHLAALIHSLSTAGSAPPESHRYVQDRELYELFITGSSALESMYFFLYFVGKAAAGVKAFPLVNTPQRINVRSASGAFQNQYGPTDPLVKAMTAIQRDTFYRRWSAIRNVLTHRAAPGRMIYAAMAPSVEPASEVILPAGIKPLRLDADDLQRQHDRLARSLARLIMRAERFSRAHL